MVSQKKAGTMEAMQAALQRLLDEEAIKKVHLHYCRSVDRRDWELLRSCYHPDAVDDHGDYVGGVDGFIEFCESGTLNFTSTTHLTCNQLVEVDGDVAWTEFYGLAYHRLPADADGIEKDFAVNTRWVDRFERRDGEWRIAKRTVVVDTDRVDPVTERWVPQEQYRGRRDRTDPSYER
jgi:ketosteroid isomerase-like protein